MVTISIRSKHGEKETVKKLLLEGLVEEKKGYLMQSKGPPLQLKNMKRNMNILRLFLLKDSLKVK